MATKAYILWTGSLQAGVKEMRQYKSSEHKSQIPASRNTTKRSTTIEHLERRTLLSAAPAVATTSYSAFPPASNAPELQRIGRVSVSAGLSVAGPGTTTPLNVGPTIPTVVNVFVGGTSWAAGFRSFLASSGAGDSAFGFRLAASEHGEELPWTNFNKVSIRFSENVNVAADDLVVRGVNTATYSPATIGAFAYDAATFTATWTLATAGIPSDKLLLDLDAEPGTGVTSSSGVRLDGDWTNLAPGGVGGADTFPSGNGTPGGDFRFRVNVLPGDVNRNGGITSSDVTSVRDAQGSAPGGAQYTIFKDINGSGSILGNDVTLVRSKQGTALPVAEPTAPAQMLTKTENFTVNPNWDGHNNRSATPPARSVTQNFGFKTTNHFGQPSGGEVGGVVNPTGEPAYYAQTIATQTFNDGFMASGKVMLDGGGNTLLGFFNSNTVNEWRNPNAVMFRLYGRGSYFLAYTEYGTAKWRVGADAFVSGGTEVQFPVNTALDWTLKYSPTANGGNGQVTATLGNAAFGVKTSTTNLAPGHKLDTASLNRFGILDVNKSWDSPGSLWIDNVSINGATAQEFTGTTPPADWAGLNNNTTYNTNNVRFRFDFGYSNTNNAGGAGAGEMGGNFFRGDSRQASTMAYYGDVLPQTLSFNTPLYASGKLTFKRGVTDSTVHLGFFHNTDSVRVSTAQSSAVPENFLGATIEGPSAEGFFFYPTYNSDVEAQGSGGNRGNGTPPYIYPDSTTHNWTLSYNPSANGGSGQIVVTLDGKSITMNLTASDRNLGAHFNRFGFVTTHIDGNGQTVFVDDVTYTVGFG
jgi:hypothetical protein